jgi:transposase-like protein
VSSDRTEELRLLAEIARWTRESALPIVRERVERLVDTDGKKRVYEAIADGSTSVAAVERGVGVNHRDIRTWIDEWEAEGIAVPDAKPPKATFTLRELGIAAAPPRPPRNRRPRAK